MKLGQHIPTNFGINLGYNLAITHTVSNNVA